MNRWRPWSSSPFRHLGRAGIVALALAAVVVQESLPDAVMVAVAAAILAPVAAFRISAADASLQALAIGAVLAVAMMGLVAAHDVVDLALMSAVAAGAFAALHRIAPQDSSPVPVYVALVVGALAARFGWEWGAVALLGGLLVNGAVALVVLIRDDPSHRTTPMATVLSVTALVAVVTRPYLGP